MLTYCRRNLKLSSYSLNAVATSVLSQQKEDVHHSIIADLQKGSADDRRRLAGARAHARRRLCMGRARESRAVYCLKDAWLPMKIMDKQLVRAAADTAAATAATAPLAARLLTGACRFL